MALTTTRGRPARNYTSKTFGEIKGLTKRDDGRWQVRSTGYRWSEPDEAKAIERFHDLTGQSRPVHVSAPVEGRSFGNATILAMNRFVASLKDGTTATPEVTVNPAQVTVGYKLDPKVVGPWLRDLLLNDPVTVAMMTGLPAIAHWRRQAGVTAEAAKLSSLWPVYLKHTKATEPKTIAKTKDAWDGFVKFVGVETCEHVSDQQVLDYGTHINTDPAYGAKTQGLIFSRVKAVVNRAAKKAVNVGLLPVKLKMLETRHREGDEDAIPSPMSKATFRRLLDAARARAAEGDRYGDRMTALLLMGLNCAMYIDEVCSVKWRHVNVEEGTLIMRRGKTKVIRAAALWPETVEALKRLRTNRAAGEYVLTSQRGTRYNEESCRKWYGEFRDRHGVVRAKGNDFNALRDAAYSQASERVMIQKVKVLAGHKVGGLSDAYIARNPKFVAEACRVVYDAFMV